MPDITHASASAAILRHVEEGRLIQHDWHSKADDGRKLACLLGAIHPSVRSPAECNGDLMPMWMAELVPVLFDGLPVARIYPQARRFAELISRWYVLRPNQWRAVEIRFKIKAIDGAVEAARPACEGESYWPSLVAAAERVCKALNGDGDLIVAGCAAEAVAAVVAAKAVAAVVAGGTVGSGGAAVVIAWAARFRRPLRGGGAEVARWAVGAAEVNVGAAEVDDLFTFLMDQIEAEIG